MPQDLESRGLGLDLSHLLAVWPGIRQSNPCKPVSLFENEDYKYLPYLRWDKYMRKYSIKLQTLVLFSYGLTNLWEHETIYF